MWLIIFSLASRSSRKFTSRASRVLGRIGEPNSMDPWWDKMMCSNCTSKVGSGISRPWAAARHCLIQGFTESYNLKRKPTRYTASMSFSP